MQIASACQSRTVTAPINIINAKSFVHPSDFSRFCYLKPDPSLRHKSRSFDFGKWTAAHKLCAHHHAFFATDPVKIMPLQHICIQRLTRKSLADELSVLVDAQSSHPTKRLPFMKRNRLP